MNKELKVKFRSSMLR